MVKTKRRLLCAGLAILVLLAAVMFVIPTADVKAEWDGSTTTFARGRGTEDDPFQIANASQLAHLAVWVNEKNYDNDKTYYKLTADIDVSGHEWTPIGWQYGAMPRNKFKGNFDGCGYTVSGITINKQ